MKTILFMVVCAFAFCRPALADQQSDQALSTAMQTTASKTMQAIFSAACRGPIINYNLTGLPGNQVDGIRCQAISVTALACEMLAVHAGSFSSMVADGQTTYDSLGQTLDDTPGTAPESTSGLVLAQEAPPNMTPVQIFYLVLNNCMATIKLN